MLQQAKLYRVLVVDSDSAQLFQHAPYLIDLGIELIRQDNSRGIPELISIHKPDVVLMAFELPGIKRQDLDIAIRELDADDLPILYTDAAHSVGGDNVGKLQRRLNYLAKPIDPERLCEKVRVVAQKRQQRMVTRDTLNLVLYERQREHQALNKHAIVSITDHQGTITYANDKFCQISGYTREELLGGNHRIIKSGEHSELFYRSLWQTISAGDVWNGVMCNKAKNGELYWEESTITPFLNEQNKPYQYIAIRTDITAIKRQEKELAKSRDQAQKANRAKSEFLSNMSHELRTPLNAILGFSQLLEYDPELSDRQLENVGEIVRAGRHLLELINDILDLSKIESGHIEVHTVPVEICGIIEECLKLLSSMALSRGISLHHSCRRDTYVHVDRVRVKQVLINLLSNAIKYNRDGGKVDLVAEELANGRVQISVIDTGPGIHPESLEEIYKPFFRLHADVNIEGTGIGMAIVKNIVELMEGSISVESTVGQGSRFAIELPGIDAKKAAPAETEEAGQDNSFAEDYTEQKTVLYIEDNSANLKLVEQLMMRKNYVRLLTATTSEEGVEIARKQTLDLVLLDINLPGMDGYQTFALLQSDPTLRHIPVVAVTANALTKDIERCNEMGFAECLTKPVDMQQFDTVVDKILLKNKDALV